MKKLFVMLVAVLLTFSSPVYSATYVYTSPNRQFQVRLFDEPCVGLHGKRAEVVWEGKKLKACYSPLDAEHIFLVDESGDSGAMPLRVFSIERGV